MKENEDGISVLFYLQKIYPGEIYDDEVLRHVCTHVLLSDMVSLNSRFVWNFAGSMFLEMFCSSVVTWLYLCTLSNIYSLDR